jgi:parallel beta-helix repeat protein
MARPMILLAILGVSLLASARAATYLVRPNGMGDFPTIQAGIHAAVDGDVLLLADGTFAGAGNRDIDFQGKAITLRSESGRPEQCTIDCQPSRAFEFHSGESASSRIQYVTIMNGNADGGGAILCRHSSSPSIEGCVLRDNYAHTGGAIECRYSSPSLSGCTIVDNTAEESGGGICLEHSSPTISNCVLESNHAMYGGALICCWASAPVVSHCMLRDNAAAGSAVYW